MSDLTRRRIGKAYIAISIVLVANYWISGPHAFGGGMTAVAAGTIAGAVTMIGGIILIRSAS